MTREEYLAHYGVMGMKWGIRKGKAGAAYGKGVKKLKKMARKADKLERKSAHYEYRATKKRNWKKAAKLERKGKLKHYQSIKLQQKGKKFYKKMEKTFKNVPVDQIDPIDLAYAKRYANSVLG